MKLIIPLMVILLSSCSLVENTDDTNWVQSLEKQIQELKIENANLKENQSLINAWWVPSEIQSTQSSWWTTVINPLFPEWTTFEETDSTECMKNAYNNYLAAWIKKCREIGYTKEEINTDKCQLSTTFINQLKTKKTNDEGKCGPQ